MFLMCAPSSFLILPALSSAFFFFLYPLVLLPVVLVLSFGYMSFGQSGNQLKSVSFMFYDDGG